MSPVKSPKDKTVDEKGEADELPPGWRIEVKKRKSGSEKKVDRFYTDPVTGYIFRSLRDAQRYLKTGELGRYAIKPKNRDDVATDTKDEKLHMEKREEKRKSKRQTSETLRHKRPSTDKSELATRASKRVARVRVDAVDALSPPEPKTCQATRSAGVAVDAPSPPQPKTRRATRQAEIKIDSPPPSSPDTRTSSQATQTKPINSATPKVNGKKTEASKIDSPPPSSPDTRTSRQATQAKPVNSATLKVNDKKTEAPPVTPKEHNKKIEMRPTISLPRKDQPPPPPPSPPPQPPPPAVILQASLVKQESPVVNPTISNSIPQNRHVCGSEIKSDSSVNFSMNDLWTDPCIEFAVKTLTGAIPFGDLNKVENFSPTPLQVPLAELWTDPCIEFAVKTLTGAIPVGEDNHLQYNRPASNANPQGPRGFSLPNPGMNRVLDPGCFSNQQQNLQNSGKFVTGSNGQGSRSRFFQ